MFITPSSRSGLRLKHKAGRSRSQGLKQPRSLTHDYVCDDEGEDEDCEERQRQDEHVEEAVVPLSDAVPHPGAVVIEPLCTEIKRESI